MYRNNNTELYILAMLILILLLGTVTATAANAAEYPSVSAEAAVLYQPERREFVYEKNADKSLPMASTTKIMTALVALESLPSLDEAVEIPAEAAGIEGSSAYLKAGECVTAEELLYALMLRSANDAAAALAFHVSGGIEEFSALMNEKATELGLTETHFTNPHGLDCDGHYTTARELALITAEAMKNPIFRRICSTYSTSYRHGELSRTYVNHNKLLKRYEGCIGVKTGYTKKCGRCLVSASERDGVSFIAVTLDAPDDWRDHTALHDLGYRSYEALTLIGAKEYGKETKLLNSEADSINVTNREGLSVTVRKGDHKIQRHVELPRYLIAPMKDQESVGRISFTVDGEYVGEVGLIATEAAEEIKEESIFSKISGFFGRIFGK